ncbi:hypothetical protein [Lentzea sp. NBRC 102530]|uniref:hypothetical protein n=1 Tax=Lentzea sp. NBRC 102530 TaxID=3032201 RepID=UPI0024A37187|nr:hypothetical protein [Lentzea sp. NBRC 102530]GLY55016.1 hypothetical protein Lesp01_86710 [Lentzea sp. NBRC 102530]
MNFGRWRLAIVAFVVFLTGLVFWASGSDEVMETGDKLASIMGPPLTIAGLVAAVVFGVLGLRANAVRAARDPEQALEDLARLVGRQWEREAGSRGLTRQDPLDVRWVSTARPVAPSAAEIIGTGAVSGRPVRLKLRGGVGDLADALHELPGHQLVVLGEPGSGKTSAAILLTLRLLGRRDPGDLVPVLFSLASWDPVTQDLDAWMVQRLAVDHPVFRDRGVHGPDVARDLIDGGLVLPVLDALDEVPLKADALRGIARFVGRNKPMLLTCRAEDYEEVIRETGAPVGRAAVVELRPVDAGEAARYLEAGTVAGDERWQPVVTALGDEPDGVLARALSTPLAVYLAKTAFTPPSTDPAGLVELPTAAAVEQRLLEAYLPALYPSPEEPRKWLAFLARRLAVQPAAGNLGWWRLFFLLPVPRVVVAASRGALAGFLYFAITLLSGLVTDVVRSPTWVGTVAASCAVLVGGVMMGATGGALVGLLRSVLPNAWKASLPVYVAISWASSLRYLVLGVAIGFAAVTIGDLIASRGTEVSVLAMAGSVFGFGLSTGFLMNRISATAPINPRSSLAADRTATIFVGTTVFLTTIVVFSAVYRSRDEFTGASLVYVIGMAAAVMCVWPMAGAWIDFTVARIWFALCRKLPWHLMDFLEEAHERGVLRQVGAAYEFRHQRLQQYFGQKVSIG